MLKCFEKESQVNKIFKDIHSQEKVSVFGFNLGERALISANIDKPICYVTAENDGIENLKKDFISLGRKVAVLDYAPDDFSLHTLEFGSATLNAQVAIFKALNNQIDTLIVTAETLSTLFAPKKVWQENTLKFAQNQEIDLDILGKKLTAIGYNRVDSIDGVGQWAKRGDVLDIFPLNSELPFRLHFFDTQIEKITTFNILTQYKIDEVKEITVCPNGFKLEKSISLDGVDFIDSQISIIQKNMGKYKNPDDCMTILDALSHAKSLFLSGIPRASWQFCAGFTDSARLGNLLADWLFIYDQPKQIWSNLTKHLTLCKDNINSAINSGQLSNAHKNLIADFAEIVETLPAKSALSFQSLMTQNKFFVPTKVYNFDVLPLPKLGRDYQGYANELQEFLNNKYKIILCVADANQAGDAAEKLGRYIKVEQVASVIDVKLNRINILVNPLYLGACFTQDKILILGGKQNRFEAVKTKWDKKIVKVTDTFTLPEQGEYVVHAIHGIGVCEGVTQLQVGNAKRDYVVVSYKNNDRLYVPTEQMDMLGKYIGGDKNPTLSTIGGNAFEKVKQRVRESVKELAFDLLKLYREREKSKGLVMKVSPDIMQEFEQSFGFTPTPDQEKAFNDVYTDLASGKIMDRLIVGDVGYGKTEVAIRAAFVAVMSGYQAVVIAPTTILSEQHFNNFSARLKNYGVEVRCLNRFRTPKEQKQIIEDFTAGKVNILIGTHRVLSKDVNYFNLGMLILDEEQRFGVGDKEKIKNIKKNVHVLTLTATPIPRTLHMSLVGIRDITTIETPPLDRLPVQTIVSQFSYNLAGTAIRREKSRGGQALVVYPRVENIDIFAQSLRAELGENFVVAVAHGQMDKSKIEEVMLEFYKGNIDVLVATTLIENGIDVPNANTLFVVSAEKLGLSQLYQLRGRVGRSDRLAYAYFTYMDEGKLTGNAYERLSVLMQYTALGSGFKIAMRDLEIRGAGNILGPEQHGQMEKVGYDMYCKLLDSSIASLKGEPVKEDKIVKIEVDIDAYIPQDFITDKVQRMEVYSAIANINNDEDYTRVQNGIVDKWGRLPNSILGLCKVALLKAKCQQIGAVRASVTQKHTNIYFEENAPILNKINNLNLSNFIVYKKDNLIIIKADNTDLAKDLIWKNAFLLLENLIAKLYAN